VRTVSNPDLLCCHAGAFTHPRAEWLHEYKLDGYRIEAVLRDGNCPTVYAQRERLERAKPLRVAFDLATLPSQVRNT
jgi:hypothetical protein